MTNAASAAEQELSRRRMIGAGVGLGVTVVAGAAGYYVATTSSVAAPKVPATTPAPAGAPANALAAVDAIPDGGGLVLAEKKLVLTRNGSTVHCFTAVCTHAGCLVGGVESGVIACPCHGSAFDPATGAVVNGPAQEPLAAVPVTVENGQVIGG